jgi:hypothetical protein
MPINSSLLLGFQPQVVRLQSDDPVVIGFILLAEKNEQKNGFVGVIHTSRSLCVD